ncbi:MAG: hypothetical protein JWL62_3862 [Hyphomicrobiales bacterium]|nr:hypothetical protein [Hyphomicrobiales bacterium]
MAKYRMTFVAQKKSSATKPAKWARLLTATGQVGALTLLSFTAVSIILRWGGLKVF